MKTTIHLLLTFLILASTQAQEKIAELKTVKGRVYKNVTISRHDAGSITIKHSGGVRRIWFSDLKPVDSKSFKLTAEAEASIKKQLAYAANSRNRRITALKDASRQYSATNAPREESAHEAINRLKYSLLAVEQQIKRLSDKYGREGNIKTSASVRRKSINYLADKKQSIESAIARLELSKTD